MFTAPMVRSLICCLLLILSPFTPAAEPDANYAKRFPAKWLERNGEIRLSTICYNYPSASYMYRLCRLEAANTFNSRCQRYRAVMTHQPDTLHYQALADKYCEASRRYQPDDEVE